jgi:PleD family two-component response regulator
MNLKGNASNKNKKILIVDDICFNIKALEIILKYKSKIDIQKICKKALNGEEALQFIK